MLSFLDGATHSGYVHDPHAHGLLVIIEDNPNVSSPNSTAGLMAPEACAWGILGPPSDLMLLLRPIESMLTEVRLKSLRRSLDSE